MDPYATGLQQMAASQRRSRLGLLQPGKAPELATFPCRVRSRIEAVPPGCCEYCCPGDVADLPGACGDVLEGLPALDSSAKPRAPGHRAEHLREGGIGG
jgi:hypothetical protein